MVLGIISRAAAAVNARYRKIRRQQPRQPLSELVSDDELFGIPAGQALLAAVLLKRGKKENTAFHHRHVELTNEYVSYGNTHGGAVLDKIRFPDIAGVVWKRMEPEDWGAAFRQEEQFDDERNQAQKVASCLDNLDFVICTTQGGYFRGRSFVFRTASETEREVWATSITRVFSSSKKLPPETLSAFAIWRRKARWMYLGDRCQIFVAILIFLNFLLNIAESQFLPEKGTSLEKIISSINLIFTTLFTIELCVNMFATLFFEFFRDAWNWFDSVVVLVSLVSVFLDSLPGVSVLRLLRAFRVFRLFKRIPSLRQILVAINQSIPPMLNAFALVTLLTSIYAIMCVTFFKTHWPELFGDFFTALFTMFQIMTGDQWGDIARELFVATGNGPAVACFFVSYQLFVALVLVNVVIAVLLEEFAKAAQAEKNISNHAQSNEKKDGAAFNQRCVLDRLVQELQFFEDAEEFEEKIRLMFLRLTQQLGLFNGERERMDSATFRHGMAVYGMVPPIAFKEEDWEKLVVAPGLAAADGTLGLVEFGILIRQAFRRNQLRELSHVMEMEPTEWNATTIAVAMMSVKCILLESSYIDDSIYKLPPAEGEGSPAPDKVPCAEDGGIRPFHALSDTRTVRAQAEKLSEELAAMRMRLTDIEAEVLGRKMEDETPRARSRSLGGEETAAKAPEMHSLFQTNLFNLFTPPPKSIHANGGGAAEATNARTRPEPEEGRLTARRHSATTPKTNGWSFFAAATQSPFDNAKDGLLGGLGAVGMAFPFLGTTPHDTKTKTAGSSPANTPPFSPTSGAKSPGIEISSWRPARVKK